MSFNEGDFVRIDYSMRRASDNTLMRTTSKKIAEENGTYGKEASYEPQLVVLGKDRTFKALAEAIKGMSVGEEKKITLEASDAFGERNKELVRIIPIAEFRKRDINPEPGTQIDIDGAIAVVKSVNSGRVMVDANHPLAGEKLVYEVKVLGKASDDKEKVEFLANAHNLKPEHVTVSADSASLRFGSTEKKDEYYSANKIEFSNEVFEYMQNMKKLVIEEEYSREEKAKEEQPVEEQSK